MYPRVRDILKSYKDGGLENLKVYFEQENLAVDPSTWSGQIKKCIDDGFDNTVVTEIELMIEKFNLI
jgi:hypothetical protein